MKKLKKLITISLACIMVFGAALTANAEELHNTYTSYYWCSYCKGETPHDSCRYCGEYCRPCGRNQYGVNHYKNH